MGVPLHYHKDLIIELCSRAIISDSSFQTSMGRQTKICSTAAMEDGCMECTCMYQKEMRLDDEGSSSLRVDPANVDHNGALIRGYGHATAGL